MTDALLVFSTVDGHTREICGRLKDILADAGHRVTMAELTADSAPDPEGFGLVVIGASIRYGRHRPEVAEFIERHAGLLQQRPVAFFSVNAVARKPARRTAETNPYVRKFVAGLSWAPAVIEIFGGRIDYPSYRFFDRTMIRLIMWMTGGPTDPTATVDFTDWDQVDAFGRRLAAMAS